MNRLSELVKAPADQLVDRVEKTISALKNAERDLAKVRSAQLAVNLDGIIGEGKDVGEVRIWSFVAPEGTSGGDLRELVVKASGRARHDIPVVMVGASVTDDKVSIVAGASPQAIALGITANAILQAASPSIDGRGGGKDDFAQGGGTNAAGIPAAFEAVEDLIRQRTGQ